MQHHYAHWVKSGFAILAVFSAYSLLYHTIEIGNITNRFNLIIKTYLLMYAMFNCSCTVISLLYLKSYENYLRKFSLTSRLLFAWEFCCSFQQRKCKHSEKGLTFGFVLSCPTSAAAGELWISSVHLHLQKHTLCSHLHHHACSDQADRDSRLVHG